MGMLLGKRNRCPADHAWTCIYNTTFTFVAFKDGTTIYKNGNSVLSLNKQGSGNVAFSSGDIITSNNPLSFASNTSGLTALSHAWAGKKFAHSVNRSGNLYYFYMRALKKNTSVRVYRNGSLVSTLSVTTNSTTTYNAGSQYTFIFESDEEVMIYGGYVPSQDCLPLYPAQEENTNTPTILYGTGSSAGYIVALENSTSIVGYHSDGTTSSWSLNKGGTTSFGNGGSQFAGSSTKLVSNKPIACASYADADGGEQTPFMGKESFGKHFVIPTNRRDFAVFVSDKPATLKFYNSSGTLQSTRTMTGSANGGGIYRYRATGTDCYERVFVEASEPVCAIFEGVTDDETILMAHHGLSAVSKEEAIASGKTRHGFGPKVFSEGLSVALNAAVSKSYSGSGTTFYDLSGNNANGTLVNTPTFDNTKRVFTFDGSNEQINLTVNNVNTTAGGFNTVMFYMYWTGGDSQFPMEFSSYRLWIYGGNWGFNTGNGDIYGITTAELLNQWVHITAVFYNGAYTGNNKLYKNGVNHTLSQKRNSAQSATASTQVTVGGYRANNSYAFGGKIADFKIYNRKLTDEQILQNFRTTRKRFGL